MRQIGVLLLGFLVAGCENVENSAMTKETTIESVRIIGGDAVAALKSDPVEILSARIEQDSLVLQLRYGGGSREHDFAVYCLNALAKSLPAKATLYLTHDSKGDLAKALITEERSFDLGAMAEFSVKPIQMTVYVAGNTDAAVKNLMFE